MRAPVAVATLALLAPLTACDTSSYPFKVDKSISITAPKARATVDRPLLVKSGTACRRNALVDGCCTQHAGALIST